MRARTVASALTLAGLLALGLAGLGAVQAPDDRASLSEEEAARTLLQLMEVDEQLVPSIKAMLRHEAEMMYAEPERIDAAERWIDEHVTWSDFEPGLIEIYTASFTRDELIRLVDFYASPLGRKTIELAPILMERGARLGARIVREKLPALPEAVEQAEG